MKSKPSNNTPQLFHIPLERRRFLKALAVASAGFTLPGYLAEALTLTPFQTQGPYYPLADDIPLDKDNDLVVMNDSLTPASGIVTYINGRVLDSSGNPIRGALVELWHADTNGVYTYNTGAGRNPAADANFAGFGQCMTRDSGGFRFRTIKAGLYTGRGRHFHWGVTIPGQTTRFTTQTYWAGDASNASDGILNGIANADQRNSVILNYTPVEGSTSGEVEATWDFVSGLTPVEPAYPNGGSLVIAAAAVAGPSDSTRFQISIPAYTGYTYEVYGNPTLGALSWGALPFALTQMGAISAHKYTATSNGTLNLFLDEKAAKGFYFVTFRVPGANTGTP